MGLRNAALWIIMISLLAHIPFRVFEFAHGRKFIVCSEKSRCLLKRCSGIRIPIDVKKWWLGNTYTD